MFGDLSHCFTYKYKFYEEHIWVNTARMHIVPKTGHILFDFEPSL